MNKHSPTISEPYSLPSQTDLSFEKLLTAGNYAYVNKDIASKIFPTSQRAAEEVFLVHFGLSINSQTALEELKGLGWRPVTVLELLSFGAHYPEVQREFPIVALGSATVDERGERRVPYLRTWYGERDLGLHGWDTEWRHFFRFLVAH